MNKVFVFLFSIGLAGLLISCGDDNKGSKSQSEASTKSMESTTNKPSATESTKSQPSATESTATSQPSKDMKDEHSHNDNSENSNVDSDKK